MNVALRAGARQIFGSGIQHSSGMIKLKASDKTTIAADIPLMINTEATAAPELSPNVIR